MQQTLIAGFALSFSLIVAIGAQNAFVLRQGIRREHVGSVVALCIALDVALMAFGVYALSGLGTLHPQAQRALALVGAAFLALYGFGAARRAFAGSGAALQAGEGHGETLAPVLGKTLALSLLNPHVYLDTVLLVGAVGAQQAASQRPAFLIGAGLASALWFTGLGAGARLLAPWFARPTAWRLLDAAVALTMWTLAARLAAGALLQP